MADHTDPGRFDGRALIVGYVRLPDGRLLASAVRDDGGPREAWVVDPERLDDDPGNGCSCPACAPHEQLGGLPGAFVDRLEDAAAGERRCGRRRRDGRPCRQPVAAAGVGCRWHRDVPLEPATGDDHQADHHQGRAPVTHNSDDSDDAGFVAWLARQAGRDDDVGRIAHHAVTMGSEGIVASLPDPWTRQAIRRAMAEWEQAADADAGGGS